MQQKTRRKTKTPQPNVRTWAGTLPRSVRTHLPSGWAIDESQWHEPATAPPGWQARYRIGRLRSGEIGVLELIVAPRTSPPAVGLTNRSLRVITFEAADRLRQYVRFMTTQAWIGSDSAATTKTPMGRGKAGRKPTWTMARYHKLLKMDLELSQSGRGKTRVLAREFGLSETGVRSALYRANRMSQLHQP